MNAPRTTEIDAISDLQGDDDVDAVEFEDGDLRGLVHAAEIDLRRFADWSVLRLVLGIAIAVAVVVWPTGSGTGLVALVGLVVIALAVAGAVEAARQRPRPRSGLLVWLALILGGGFLLVFPEQSLALVARILALVIVGWAAFRLRMDIRQRPRVPLAWPVARTLAVALVAGLAALYPGGLLQLLVVVLAFGFAVQSTVGIVQQLRRHDEERDGIATAGELVREWFDQRPKAAGDRRVLYSKVLFADEGIGARLARFGVLMTIASVIATMGILTDSTAVVIGAMLIAPLMTPLMGLAVSVVMGWPNWLARSAVIASGGIAIAIGTGFLIGLAAPVVIDVSSNAQIVGRSSPTILDLITATAAGAGGAYGLSRPDVSDSLPGVAIAISLVPPLAVVGVAYSQAEWQEGNGALLLFVTNALAIVLVGGATFILTGITPLRRLAANQQRVKTATASIVGILAIVVGALALNGAEATTNAFELVDAEEVATDWIEQTPDYALIDTIVDGDLITVVILGPAEGYPTVAELRDQLSHRLEREVTADVRVLVQERVTLEPPTR